MLLYIFIEEYEVPVYNSWVSVSADWQIGGYVLNINELLMSSLWQWPVEEIFKILQLESLLECDIRVVGERKQLGILEV